MITIPDWAKNIKIEDLEGREDFIAVAEDIGIENFVKVVIHFQGRTPYIPQLKTLFDEVRNKNIIKDYRKSGKNLYLVIKKYGLSESMIRRILKEENFDQLSLFEDDKKKS